MENTQEVTYRLERSPISFAYPPTPLERGIRFHGRNYFRFSASKYFPEGYPYFGLKFAYRTSLPSSLIYFAASSFAQSELELVQIYNNTPWFLANTQLKRDNCSIALNTDVVGDDLSNNLSNDKWHETKILRLAGFAYIRVQNKTKQVNN